MQGSAAERAPTSRGFPLLLLSPRDSSCTCRIGVGGPTALGGVGAPWVVQGGKRGGAHALPICMRGCAQLQCTLLAATSLWCSQDLGHRFSPQGGCPVGRPVAGVGGDVALGALQPRIGVQQEPLGGADKSPMEGPAQSLQSEVHPGPVPREPDPGSPCRVRCIPAVSPGSADATPAPNLQPWLMFKPLARGAAKHEGSLKCYSSPFFPPVVLQSLVLAASPGLCSKFSSPDLF